MMSELKQTTEILLCDDDSGLVHIREVMAEYQCHKIVNAAVIKEVTGAYQKGADLALVIGLPGTDIEMPYLAVADMVARYEPKAGDYVVLYENGYVSISPKQQFDEGYTQISFAEIEHDGETLVMPTDYVDQVTIIAQTCHEVVRAYSRAIREEQQEWEDLSKEAQDVIIGRVAYHITYPEAEANGPHDSWMIRMLSQGWKYGKTKDKEAKLHPNLKPFHHLPTEQQAKDHIFREVVLQATKQ